jgi:hypothetical protein
MIFAAVSMLLHGKARNRSVGVRVFFNRTAGQPS